MRFRSLMFSAAALLSVFSGLASPCLRAQEAPKPVAIVSISPLDRLLSDTSYLLRACNIPEMSGLVTVMANQYTQGIDRNKPLGALVTLDGQIPSAVVFMPMTSREDFFGSLAGLGVEPDDLGDGLFEIDANGQTLYAKEMPGWLFVGQSEDAFGNLPANPAAALGNLPEKYDLAVRLNLQALPDEIRSEITSQIRNGFERGMAEQQAGQTEEEKEAARQMGEASIEQLEQMLADTEQVILGWAVDSKEQKVYFDGGAMFVEGSKLAQQANDAANQTSDYTAFVLPQAAAKFRFSSTIADSDKPVAKNNLKNSMAQAEKQLEQSGDLPPEAKAMILDLLKGLSALAEQTIDEGIFDGAGSLSVADDSLTVLVGGRIADGNALAAELKKAVAKLPSGPSVPTVEFDYETYEGITLHRVRVPVKIADPAAKKVFGDELLLTVGTGEKSFFFSLDPAGDASAKAAIDRMKTALAVKSSPLEGVVQLEQLLRFAQSVSPNSMLDNVIETMSQHAGKDKVMVNGSVIPRGGVYRLTLEEGVLRSIGSAAKGGGGGGF